MDFEGLTRLCQSLIGRVATFHKNSYEHKNNYVSIPYRKGRNMAYLKQDMFLGRVSIPYRKGRNKYEKFEKFKELVVSIPYRKGRNNRTFNGFRKRGSQKCFIFALFPCHTVYNFWDCISTLSSIFLSRKVPERQSTERFKPTVYSQYSRSVVQWRQYHI